MPDVKTSPAFADTSVPLPTGLHHANLVKAVDYLQTETSGLVEIYYEQMNVFSTIVGIFGSRGLSTFSRYEPNPNRLTAQGRFPDLRLKGARSNPPAKHSLESKGSKRIWAIQAHYDHAGWYVVWRYLVDDTLTITGDPVVVWRVHVAYIKKAEWKYEPSRAGSGRGGRTHTFALRKPAAKLRGLAAYERDDIVVTGEKPVPR